MKPISGQLISRLGIFGLVSGWGGVGAVWRVEAWRSQGDQGFSGPGSAGGIPAAISLGERFIVATDEVFVLWNIFLGVDIHQLTAQSGGEMAPNFLFIKLLSGKGFSLAGNGRRLFSFFRFLRTSFFG